jgi:hypothetical protein
LAEAYGAGAGPVSGEGITIGAGGGDDGAVASDTVGSAGISDPDLGIAGYTFGSGYVTFEIGTSLSAIFAIFSSGESLSI